MVNQAWLNHADVVKAVMCNRIVNWKCIRINKFFCLFVYDAVTNAPSKQNNTFFFLLILKYLYIGLLFQSVKNQINTKLKRFNVMIKQNIVL